MAITDVERSSGEVVSELIVRLVGTTKPREIELIADLLAAERDRRAIRPLLMRLGDSYVQEDADIEDAVCSALVALDVMCSHGNRTFFFLPGDARRRRGRVDPRARYRDSVAVLRHAAGVAMEQFAIGCALGCFVAAAICAPVLAPWPIRVRILAAAQAIDPASGLGVANQLDARAVTVADVMVDAGHVMLRVEELGCGTSPGLILSRDGCAPAEVAQLDGWAALDTPLLMITDDDGAAVHLYGPCSSLTNFSRVRATIG